jgi:hypothetical protein
MRRNLREAQRLLLGGVLIAASIARLWAVELLEVTR